MASASEIVGHRLRSGRHTVVKLLGDSITHGVGGTGFEMNGEEICCGVRRNPNGFCWAKLFREYLEEKYPCTVINNGIGGITIEFVIEHFAQLVDQEDDLILCTIGTNNRHQYFTDGPKRTYEQQRQCFFDNILKLNAMLQATGKDYVFFANIPAAASDELDGPAYWRIMHMNDINELYKMAQKQAGFPIVSLYDRFLEHCHSHSLTVDSLLIDGLHPNDEGYRVMFRLICEALEV